MNLSCGNCKQIRPFSGEPPKCDVCGWKSNAPVPERPSSGWSRAQINLLLKTAFWVIAIMAAAIYFFSSEQDRLAKDYNVAKDKVVIEPKPHGCDFNDAPLGNKHCHFEKSVDVTRACPGPDCKVTAVYVSWTKVEE